MCIIIHIRRNSPGPIYHTDQSPPETIYLPQDRPQTLHPIRRWWYRVVGVRRRIPSGGLGGCGAPECQLSNSNPPPYNDANQGDDTDLEDGPPTPDANDCPELVFDEDNRSNLPQHEG
ncbi:hypothetical protein AOQ84DRAFT_375993 [Glonium stellatum]|uniref:Uncharacterized protein n=1 Tax=Glonium stellatum TaxID=574774 RepID=A0A8E2F2T9_9PEZI|nr:hypothetical protein AOQ84DRAFT_375993 [Glonium stellatum]